MKKRIFLVFLVIAMIVSVTACGSSRTSDDVGSGSVFILDGPEETAESKESQKPQESAEESSEVTPTLSLEEERVLGSLQEGNETLSSDLRQKIEWMLPVLDAAVIGPDMGELPPELDASDSNAFWYVILCCLSDMDPRVHTNEPIKASEIRDIAYAAFLDFNGTIPAPEEDRENVTIDATGDYHISMGQRGTDFTTIDNCKINSDGTMDVIVVLRYEWDGVTGIARPDTVFMSEAPQKSWKVARAVRVHLIPNSHVNTQSARPFYYTIASSEVLYSGG